MKQIWHDAAPPKRTKKAAEGALEYCIKDPIERARYRVIKRGSSWIVQYSTTPQPTPGPWEVVRGKKGHLGDDVIDMTPFVEIRPKRKPLENDFGKTIAVVESEEDAELLAAAPVFLQTLETLLSDFTHPDTMEEIRTGVHVALIRKVLREYSQ